ncbi:tetratricopeptide repeat protein [Ramlibacter sp.]|uniref:tetratricopeptide repeat protein n=1 Tax=Ramlibacter sp. TaxID=1917967 RepID=UPI0017A0EA7A|nr:tetratricopeptide repeat protein [Ramlibacter sp.]MBA2673774.1 tetratricopeptide repeat protein [Ramlibacter sp.]
MPPATDALKKKFREGQRAQAIAECEALSQAHPADRELKRLCAMMHVVMRDFGRALVFLRQIRDPGNENADVLFNIGLCERELKNFRAAQECFRIYTEKFPDPDGWAARGYCETELGQPHEAIASFGEALKLAPNLADVRVARGDLLHGLGDLAQAAADYKAALALVPNDDATLKKATLCLLELNRGEEGIQLCRDVLKVHPDSLTAKLGAEWLLSRLVPLWHVPMMNEPERNQAFFDGLASAVTPDSTVFEIGTGSGLLAMMAAKLGAKQVVTCEAVALIAGTAAKIVARNGYQDRIKVLAKPSHAVELGTDLPEKADILVHEIFSSELLGEHVLPAIEDAKARLLKPGGRVVPAAASIMVALVGGTTLGRNLHVHESFGFDLRDFNAIHPRKRPLYREDLSPVLMSDAVEAFRFDFCNNSVFPAQKKRLDIPVTQGGLCHGVIQWIRIELAEGVVFENHPSRSRPVSNWQHTVYGFNAPVHFELGAVVAVNAMHDRARPWFERA